MKNITLTDLLLKYGEDDKARAFLEKLRWPKGAICPRCQSDSVHKIAANPKKKIRAGLYFCGGCRKEFTVTVGTIMESSHIPLGKWIAAMFLMCASKKAISSHQLHRMLGITYKSAWFMSHRIRHAMSENPRIGKLYGTVEVDETYVGGVQRGIGKRASAAKKTPVMALVERKGRLRVKAMPRATSKALNTTIDEHVDKSSRIVSDEHRAYRRLEERYIGGHEAVKHSLKEYVRGDVHVNTDESFFALLKRGITGSFHHVSRQHLQRYCDEFAFRWNNRKISDGERMENAIGMIEGKRLTYRD